MVPRILSQASVCIRIPGIGSSRRETRSGNRIDKRSIAVAEQTNRARFILWCEQRRPPLRALESQEATNPERTPRESSRMHTTTRPLSLRAWDRGLGKPPRETAGGASDCLSITTVRD